MIKIICGLSTGYPTRYPARCGKRCAPGRRHTRSDGRSDRQGKGSEYELRVETGIFLQGTGSRVVTGTPLKERLKGVVRRLRRHRRRQDDPGSQQPGADSGGAIDDLFRKLVVEAVERGADSDHITAAFDQATQAAADVIAERLRANAPRMLREHRDFRRGFEQRLQQRWGPALDLYECVRVCCLQAGETFRSRYERQNDDNDQPRYRTPVVLVAEFALDGGAR
jgi:hypothetical protein